MSNKIALVTGANKGLGKETARQLAQAGVTVWLGSRDAARGEAAAAELRAEGLDVRAVALDMENPATFAAVRDALQAEYGRLDILVNNAGICLQPFGSSTVQTTEEVLRQTFEVNFFRLVELTQLLLPLIQAAPAGRIVNVSSILASNTLHADPESPIAGFRSPAYDISKTAVNAYTVHLAMDLRDTAVRVNAAHPGWVKTDMGGDEAPMDVVQGAKTMVDLALAGDDAPTGTYVHLGQPLPW